MGPFDHKPTELRVSPFMTKDKPDSDTGRTIVHFSSPKGKSVNFGVVFNYPSVDDIVKKLLNWNLDSYYTK